MCLELFEFLLKFILSILIIFLGLIIFFILFFKENIIWFGFEILDL